MMLHKTKKPARPVILCILDGWGYAEPGPKNAISQAKTPVFDRWWKTLPHAFLDTSGKSVGLPEGQMGNSEVGHMNIGAGRVVKQDLPRIDEAIANGELAKNPVLGKIAETLKKSGQAFHIMGLLSPGGVHSHQRHMLALANFMASHDIPVRIHAFLDGRDTPPKSADQFLKDFEERLDYPARSKIATVSGRYYAMDRDKRWERIEKAYAALASGQGNRAESAREAVKKSYEKDISDEFVLPTVIGDYTGMENGDAFLMTNFRADRAREILTALVDPDFEGFERKEKVSFSSCTGMVEYSDDLNGYLTPLFRPEEIRDSLGEVVSKAGLKQLRIAETEKYAHVTFFLNGGEEKVFPGEERTLIPSPKVATYDLKPEMSAPEVTEKLVDLIGEEKFDLIVVNFANPDMVGHTGKMDAAIKAVETVDEALGKIENTIEKTGGIMLVTADHGNVEQMENPETKAPHTAHTTFQVPVLLVNPPAAFGESPVKLKNGTLADVAPTILTLLHLKKPEAMTGQSLIKETTKADAPKEHV